MASALRRVRRDRFLVWLTSITVAGFVLRLAYVLIARRHAVVGGDAFFYHEGANLLADGKGFIQSFYYLTGGKSVEAADHPPLYLLFLASSSVIGLRGPVAHMVWSSLLGSGTIAVTGLLGRRVAGARAGLLSAAIVAFYPNVWLHDGALLSETMAIFVATVAVLLAYRALEHPSLGRVSALGAACGAAALARSELVFLVLVLLLPVTLAARGPRTRERLQRFAVGALVAVAITAPWVAYNLTRFEHPVFLSTQFEQTLAGANCRDTYSGPRLGFLTGTCLSGLDPTEDESVNDRLLRQRAVRFVRRHLGRVPVVVAARVGRVLGVYRADQQIELYEFEGRARWVGILGTISFYVVAAGAIAGAVVVRRRHRAPLFPLLVLPGLALVTVAATYGTNRFRASAETSIAVLAAIALDALLERIAKSRASRSRRAAG